MFCMCPLRRLYAKEGYVIINGRAERRKVKIASETGWNGGTRRPGEGEELITSVGLKELRLASKCASEALKDQ